MRFAVAAVFLLALGSLAGALAPPAAAIPGEPTADVTISPTQADVDASGVNAVDTTFFVNVTASNMFGVRDHTVWVNISFSVDRSWATNPAFQNLTFSLAPMESQNTSIPVTVTVPPGVSSTNAAIFAARFTEENDLRFSSGASGNRTAQIHIKQTFSTSASFLNGRNNATAIQGQDANFSVEITNNGNGDAGYDAQVMNQLDLQAEEVTVVGTDPAVVPQGGSAVVRVILHANPTAITGNKSVQIRVFATAAGDNPPPGARADLTGFIEVKAKPVPPPPGNNTTPPPPANNTTQPPQTNQSSNNQPVSVFQWLFDLPKNPPLLLGILAVIIAALALGMINRRRRNAQRERAAARDMAREQLRRRRAVDAARAAAARGPPAPGQAPRPVGQPAPRAVPRRAPQPQEIKRAPPQ